MDRVNFFIVGAMRSGTSSLRDALKLHTMVNMAPREPMFFSHPNKFDSVEDYHALFDWSDRYAIRGEKSPTYAVSERAPQELAKYNSNAKIIWTLREPIRRAVSHFQHARFRVPDAITILESIANREELERQRDSFAYVFRSEYHKQITRWLTYFPRHQHHIIIWEELLADPAIELRRLFEFLEIAHEDIELPFSKNKKSAAFAENLKATPEELAALREALADTPRQVEQILGRPIPAWRH
jgi:hypothetical protein